MISKVENDFQNNPSNLKPFYNVVINSLNAYSKTGVGTEICGYRFDWSVLPDVKYECHLTYIGELNNIDQTKLALVYIDLGVPTNVYEAKTSNSALSSNYIGFLESYLVGASSYLHSEDSTNPPIYLNGRPRVNDFFVRILDNAGQPFTASGGTALGEYIMNLQFVPIQ